MRSKIIDVECRCGAKLFHYEKRGIGRLIKCYLPRIIKDYVNIPMDIETSTSIFCPSCEERIGVIIGIKGMRAVKLNQGQIKPFRLG